jgi:hypothetical protein
MKLVELGWRGEDGGPIGERREEADETSDAGGQVETIRDK